MNWFDLFPCDSSVLALPGWKKPRLLLPSDAAGQRWRDSALYPAWRNAAMIRRIMLRARAMLGLGAKRTSESQGWLLGDFVRDKLPEAQSAVVIANPRNFTGKLVAQIRNANGEILGYVKYGEQVVARKRIRNEYFLLQQLPAELGPTPLKFGLLGSGEALLLSPVTGKLFRCNTYPSRHVVEFLQRIPVSQSVPFSDHPYTRGLMAKRKPELDHWCKPFDSRPWGVTIQHGDFAPWNLVHAPDGRLCAIDWEYGIAGGLQYLDIAYYVLAVALLLKKYAPKKAIRYTMEYLTRFTPLSQSQSRAMIALAAHEQFEKSVEDGHSPDSSEQQKRLRIWESE